jgi:hypothetical protein
MGYLQSLAKKVRMGWMHLLRKHDMAVPQEKIYNTRKYQYGPRYKMAGGLPELG